MQLLDGKRVSAALLSELKEAVNTRLLTGKRVPHLAAILVGEDPASQTYVNAKVKTCEELGFNSTLLRLDAAVSEANLLAHIQSFNENPDIDGILVQLPLPRHIDENRVIHAIDPHKDVDGFHPVSLGKMVIGQPTFISATPNGILALLDYYQIPTEGRHCVVVGRSNIVGTPMSILLSRNTYPGNCTVTLAHSRTQDLPALCKTADILIAAIGRPGFITADMVKPGAVVIDVGINRIEDADRKSGSRLVGDVDFEGVSQVAAYLTPVPGGVGKMTIYALMKNTLWAAENRSNG